MKKLIFVLIILFIISLIPNEANFKTDLDKRFEKISFKHILGTDYLGRDVFSMIKYGFIRTIKTIFIASSFSIIFGVIFGLYAGYKEGVSMYILELFSNLSLVVPSFIVALIISSIFGFSPISIGISLGIFDLSSYALQVATLTQKVKKEDFIVMAKLLNIPTFKIFKNHIIHHVLPYVNLVFSSKASSIILRYASLSFIGLGSDISKPDWGMLLYEYRIYFIDKPILILAPTISIFLLSLAFHLIFDRKEI